MVFFHVFHESIAVGDDLGFNHFAKQVVSFTSTFADACENRITFAAFSDVVYQLHDKNRFANAGTAKKADLSTTEKRLNKVDDLDARLEHFELCCLLVKRRSVTMDRIFDLAADRTEFVYRV